MEVMNLFVVTEEICVLLVHLRHQQLLRIPHSFRPVQDGLFSIVFLLYPKGNNFCEMGLFFFPTMIQEVPIHALNPF